MWSNVLFILGHEVTLVIKVIQVVLCSWLKIMQLAYAEITPVKALSLTIDKSFPKTWLEQRYNTFCIIFLEATFLLIMFTYLFIDYKPYNNKSATDGEVLVSL